MLLLLLLLLPPPLLLLPSLPLLLFLRMAGTRWLVVLPLPLLPGSGGRPSRLPRLSGARVHHSIRSLHHEQTRTVDVTPAFDCVTGRHSCTSCHGSS
jgi:hypothetical protein